LLERSIDYCLCAISAIDDAPFAYVLAFSIHFLDAVHDQRPDAAELLAKLAAYVPADGRLRAMGGTEDEALHALDVAPHPDRPARALFADDVIAADLERLAAGQREDGGWTVDYLPISPAGSLDWRGYATVRAVDILCRNGAIT
jgi:hypothetical protein